MADEGAADAVQVAIRLERADDLRAYAQVRSTFDSQVVFDVVPGPAGFRLEERAARVCKDYDALEDPRSWPGEFDTSDWAVLAGHAGATRVGGAIVALGPREIGLFEGRSDLAILWDLRVDSRWRRRRVAQSLLAAVDAWARAHGARELKVETQDTNVGACRLYAAAGFHLADVHPGAYAELPAESRLIFRKKLA